MPALLGALVAPGGIGSIPGAATALGSQANQLFGSTADWLSGEARPALREKRASSDSPQGDSPPTDEQAYNRAEVPNSGKTVYQFDSDNPETIRKIILERSAHPSFVVNPISIGEDLKLVPLEFTEDEKSKLVASQEEKLRKGFIAAGLVPGTIRTEVQKAKLPFLKRQILVVTSIVPQADKAVHFPNPPDITEATYEAKEVLPLSRSLQNKKMKDPVDRTYRVRNNPDDFYRETDRIALLLNALGVTLSSKPKKDAMGAKTYYVNVRYRGIFSEPKMVKQLIELHEAQRKKQSGDGHSDVRAPE
jgi:hypothetical protein